MSAITAPRRPGHSTLADLLALDEEARRHCELIDGEITPRGAATGRHGRAQTKVGAILDPFHRGSGGPPERPGGWIFASEADIYFDAQNTLRPDVAGWRRERIAALPDEFPLRVLPDWTCEILSTNRRNDLIRKKRVYHRHGVPHYWILDPGESGEGSLLVYRWMEGGFLEVLSAERGERVRAEPFDALEFGVGALFGDDE